MKEGTSVTEVAPKGLDLDAQVPLINLGSKVKLSV